MIVRLVLVMVSAGGKSTLAERILAVDNEILVLEELRGCLEGAGYQVVTADDGETALREFHRVQPHLVILDLLMPDMSGWDVCSQVRSVSNTPIIMLTGLGDAKDVVRGLHAGADDYVTKPFQHEVLLARVEAILRRANTPAPSPDAQLRFGGGDLVIDPLERRVIAYGEAVDLTPLEYRLLLFMAHSAGRVLSNGAIFDHVWTYDTDTNQNSVKWYVWRVRTKIEKNPRDPRFILTERGIGYRFTLT
jgi:two-component system, OmpR family, KDP operon response regulator KdpE